MKTATPVFCEYTENKFGEKFEAVAYEDGTACVKVTDLGTETIVFEKTTHWIYPQSAFEWTIGVMVTRYWAK